jgi:P4 family phage/plasmid primase-like protien
VTIDVSSLEADFDAITEASPGHKVPRAVDIAGRIVAVKELVPLSLPVGPKGPIVKAPLTADLIVASGERFAINAGGGLYIYRNGVYVPGERAVERWTDVLLRRNHCEEKWTSHLVKETVAYLTQNKAASLPVIHAKGVINLWNGLYDIASRTLLRHTPDFLSITQLPFNFDSAAECPAWDQQIEETFPADAVLDGTAFKVAAWLISQRSVQRALLLLDKNGGEGGSGKSTFLAGVSALLGSRNISKLSLHQIEEEKFTRVQLIGKIANICPDLPSVHLESSSVFKQLTGDDGEVPLEYKYGQPFQMRLFARLVFSANLPPQTRDASRAFFDRWWCLVFPNKFRNTAQERPRQSILKADGTIEPGLDDLLSRPSELSGVFNQALSYLGDVGPTMMPPSAVQAHEEFRAATDPVQVWADLNIVIDSDGRVIKEVLLAKFNDAARLAGRPVMNATSFPLRLKEIYPALKDGYAEVTQDEPPGRFKVGDRAHHWLGIRLIREEI